MHLSIEVLPDEDTSVDRYSLTGLRYPPILPAMTAVVYLTISDNFTERYNEACKNARVGIILKFLFQHKKPFH